MPAHHWVVGGTRRDREHAVAALRLAPELTAVVDAHRLLRGPYTAAGTLIRAVVPAAAPELVTRHDIEILSVAPELRGVVPATRETLTSLAVPGERTRYYSKLRTMRMAHGLTEFLRDHTSTIGPRRLVVDNVEHADPSDAEFLSVLLRRVDPGLLTVVVCAGTDEVPEGPLVTVLDRYATRHDAEPSTVDSDSVVGDPARAYVDSDCTADDPRLREAYETLDPADRALLHDRRADELESRDELSLRLGAIPYHRERGTDPAGAGAAALRFAVDHCSVMGFYHATVELAVRARALVGWDQAAVRYLLITSRMTTALAVLERPLEAEALYDEARLHCRLPMVHMGAAYATAMLYTRHHEPARRDQDRARALMNQAIAFASQIEDRRERAFQSVFMRNGLALVEVHNDHLVEALRLVDECIAEMDGMFGPDQQRLHRSVLRYNRGQVCARMGRVEEAVDDYTAVIALDPNWPEYYFDRGNLLRQLGRDDEALADYETVMRLSPPFHEAYYNRGDIRASRGDIDGALADFGYVLELDPDFVDAYVNRAALLLERGELDRAEADAREGLQRAPDNPHLHVVLGQVHADRGRYGAARLAFVRALGTDPELVTALAGHASAAFELGDLDTALADLRRAVDLAPDDAALRYNRAVVLQRTQRWDDALADLDAAADLVPDDPDIAQAREQCRLRLAPA
jgi:tetratricopeptide (TPR) repeat protein